MLRLTRPPLPASLEPLDVATPVRPSRLRWIAVLLPAVAVAVIEVLSDTVLDEALKFPLDAAVVATTVLVIGIGFGVVAFRRIDALTGTLRARNADLETRGAAARALNRVSVAIAAMTDVDEVLDAVVTHARELLRVDVALLLLEGPDGRLALRAASGAPGAMRAPGDGTADPPAPTSGRSVRATAPEATPNPADAAWNPADAILDFVDPSDARVRLSAPLQRGGQTIGLLAIGASSERGFDADEVETLASLANQATIALEHARLEARLRELAVVEERERIARELHDGIAQVLGYVNTKSQAIDGYLAGGRVDEARAQVSELGSAARAVYVDVREAILGLRSPIEPGQGLGAAVEAYARRAATDAGVALDVDIPPSARDLHLEAETSGQVYRIVQEAMTNIRKHAGARRVRLAMAVDASRLTLTIDDDGRGLARTGAPTDVPHYGLRSMQERASAIGASLDVRDGWRGGVLVRLTVPRAGHDRPMPVVAGPAAGAEAG
jgi:signal transduction histidine kinase